MLFRSFAIWRHAKRMARSIRNFSPSAINPLVTHTDQIILEFPELEDMLSPKAADNHSEEDLESNNVVESSDEK